MTTDEIRISTEDAHAWPVFAGLDIRDLRAVTVTVTRATTVPISVAAERSALAARALLGGAFPRKNAGWTLAARTPPQAGLNRLGLHLTGRNRLWAAMEHDGHRLPTGPRHERMIMDQPGPWVGSIDIEFRDLPIAVELTRTGLAACVSGFDAARLDTLCNVLASAATQTDVLRAAIGLLAEDTLAIRTHGGFDDREVSTDIFGVGDTLAKLLKDARVHPDHSG